MPTSLSQNSKNEKITAVRSIVSSGYMLDWVINQGYEIDVIREAAPRQFLAIGLS